MINFYGAKGDIDKAVILFEKIPRNIKNIVCITSMINAYNDCDEYESALNVYQEILDGKFGQVLKNECLTNAYFYCVALNSCSNCETNIALKHGQSILDDIENNIKDSKIKQSILNDEYVLNSLITLFWKCDNFDKAIQLFNHSKLKPIGKKTKTAQCEPCIKAYQAMMQCYGKRGEAEKVRQLFEELKGLLIENGQWNTIKHQLCPVYAIVFDAYGHCGMVKEAIELFNQIGENMKRDSGIFRSMVTCMGKKSIDYLIQAQTLVEENLSVFKDSPRNQFEIYMALLSCCVYHKNIDIGKKTFIQMKALINQEKKKENKTKTKKDKIFDGDKKMQAPMYTLYCNLLAACGNLKEADKIEKEMMKQHLLVSSLSHS